MSDEIRIIKTASCPSLSDRSILNYEIGAIDDDFYIRLTGNTEKGLFSKDWISFAAIQGLVPEDGMISSRYIRPIFAGRSVNSVAFLLAVLKHEGLIVGSDDKSRSWRCIDPSHFQQTMKALAVDDLQPQVTTKVHRSKSEGKS